MNEGDTLVIMESMKMEMPVESEVEGTVVEIVTKEGVLPKEGEILVSTSRASRPPHPAFVHRAVSDALRRHRFAHARDDGAQHPVEAALSDYFALAVAGYLGEESCITLYHFYQYSPDWNARLVDVPLLVPLIWLLVVLSARGWLRRCGPMRSHVCAGCHHRCARHI